MAFDIQVPQDVVFRTRQETDQSPGFKWQDLTYDDVFAGRRVVVFALPGAWTPTCSSTHLPGYDALYPELKSHSIEDVYCLAVNDSFSMNAWFNHLEVKNVKALPDGNGEFTRKMGMQVEKKNLGFGKRSWRYSMVVNDGVVEMMWVEPGLRDNADDDPFEVSDVNTMLEWLNNE
jgi:peroxiredoxin